MQIAVRVETVDELLRLIVEIALDLEIGFEQPVALVAFTLRSFNKLLLKFSLEFTLKMFAGKIRDVGKLPRTGEPELRPLAVAFVVVIAAVPLRVFGDGVAPHDVERERLGVERSGSGDQHRLFHLVGTARHPVHNLDSAETAADQSREPGDAEFFKEHPVDINGVGKRILRKR